MDVSNKADVAILGVLSAAHEAGVTPLLKTALQKFVYLLDVYEAEHTSGQSFTGETWKFLHFGPFSSAVADRIDYLAGNKDIQRIPGTRQADEIDFELFDLLRPAISLKEAGASLHARLRVGNDIQRFNRDLHGLLDYVYFKTAPMADANPGDTLAFDSCRKRTVSEFKPMEMKALAPEALKRARDSLAKLSQPVKSRFESGPFDEVYFGGLSEIEGLDTPVGLTGRARIETE